LARKRKLTRNAQEKLDAIMVNIDQALANRIDDEEVEVQLAKDTPRSATVVVQHRLGRRSLPHRFGYVAGNQVLYIGEANSA